MSMDPRKRYNDLAQKLLVQLQRKFNLATDHAEEFKTLETCMEIVYVQGTKAECERGCSVLVAAHDLLYAATQGYTGPTK